jgi:hypothetical protein
VLCDIMRRGFRPSGQAGRPVARFQAWRRARGTVTGERDPAP